MWHWLFATNSLHWETILIMASTHFTCAPQERGQNLQNDFRKTTDVKDVPCIGMKVKNVIYPCGVVTAIK